MRFLLLTAAALLPQASAAAPDAATPTAQGPSAAKPRAIARDTCRRPANHQADRGSAWREAPLKPKKLTELPPATGYMAVYRTVDGCEVPMTVVEYRSGGTRR